MAKGPDLSYTQGDTTPIRLRFKDKDTGANLDLTGYTDLFLTTDPSDSPTSGTGNIDMMPGTLVTPAEGLVDFVPSGADETAKRATSEAYPVSDAFYDVQAIDASGRRVTLLDAGSKFRIKPQINHA